MSDSVDLVIVSDDRNSRLATIGAIAVELVGWEDSLIRAIECARLSGSGRFQTESVRLTEFKLDEIRRLLRSEVRELKKLDHANGGAPGHTGEVKE